MLNYNIETKNDGHVGVDDNEGCCFQNGLRYLLNMLSMLPILRIDSEQRNAREDEDSHRQTAKTACQALKK